jgi:tRNA U55 pseudouridine synthase TruB
MSFLLRKEVGNFILSDTYTLEEINKFIKNEERECLLPMDFVFQGLDHLVLESGKYKIINSWAALFLIKIY